MAMSDFKAGVMACCVRVGVMGIGMKEHFRLLATGVLAKGVRHGNEAWMKR
jgi:hypothetical protein